MTRHLALLRGINVGGRNKVPMADLRDAFETGGYRDVRTYLQTGNVRFDGPAKVPEGDIEQLLEARFGFPLVVLLRTHRQLRAVVEKAPDGFGSQPDRYHSDAVFLKAPLTSRQVMGVIKRREGVDMAWAGTGVVYFQRLSSQRTKSRMSSIAGTPEYKQLSIRSWQTTTALLELLDDE